MVDIRYSQNFYKNKENLKRLIKLSGINSNDTVLDIGAGTGIITEQLSKYTKRVISYELDTEIFKILEERFSDYPNVVLKNENFLNTKLPKEVFKVFSNIPFSLTTDIISKITDIEYNLEEAFLFVQKESAQRYIGNPKNTQISTILSFVYEISIVEEFSRVDFKPIPKIDIVLLKFERKSFDKESYELYRDFVTYIFNQMNPSVLDTFKELFTYNQLRYIKEYLRTNNFSKPTEISSDYYSDIFMKFKINGNRYINRVDGYYSKHLNQHSKRESVHRTRI